MNGFRFQGYTAEQLIQIIAEWEVRQKPNVIRDCSFQTVPIHQFGTAEYEQSLRKFSKIMNKNTALKIRFVVLGDAIVMKVIEQADHNVLGIEFTGMIGAALENNTPQFLASNGFFIRAGHSEGLNTCYLTLGGVVAGGTVVLDFAKKTRLKEVFEQIRNALSEFADSGAFHGKDKPVPRIEKIELRCGDSAFALVNMKSERTVLFADDVEAVANLTNSEISIYDPKPEFTHEWKKVFPLTFPTENTLSPVICECLKQVNELNSQSDIEIWEFTMLTNA